MVDELKITRQRGGNHHPLSSRQFIIDYLSNISEDYGAQIHRAYKAELDRIAKENDRRYRYHRASYSSFNKVMNTLARESVIEFTGREEESDNPMFDNVEWKPVRRYYRLK
ncbi:hypothetical protein ES703_119584 [subsurface metagenome]